MLDNALERMYSTTMTIQLSQEVSHERIHSLSDGLDRVRARAALLPSCATGFAQETEDTMSATLTDRQRKGLIAFHERAAKAFTQYKQYDKAAQATAKAEALKKESAR